MPKFNLNINGVDVEAAEGREQWAGPLPPRGSYPAILKMVKVKQIKGKTDNRLQILVTLNTGDQFDGCPVWGGVNLTDQGMPYVNQFLQSLTDGSEAEFTKIKKAFYGGFVVDEKKENVLRIGTYKINSPEGQLPVMISLGHSTYTPPGENATTRTNANIVSFLLRGGSVSSSTVAEEDIAEEDDDDIDVSADDVDTDESIFDDDEEPAEVS
jgi:hypothetical protein